MNGRLHTRDGPRAPTTGTTEGVYDAHRPCHTHTVPSTMCRARQGLSLCYRFVCAKTANMVL